MGDDERLAAVKAQMDLIDREFTPMKGAEIDTMKKAASSAIRKEEAKPILRDVNVVATTGAPKEMLIKLFNQEKEKIL